MIHLSIGRRELGKTTLVVYMARKLPRRIVLDPRGVVRNMDPTIEHVTTGTELRGALLDLANSELREIVFHPHDDDLDQAFDDFTRLVKDYVVKHPHDPIAIVIDEASFFDLKHPRFQWLAKCTYRDKVHLLITAHRPVDIPTSIRSIADHWMVFSTTQEHDIKVIEHRTSPAVVTALKRLRGRAYVHWNDARSTMATQERPETWYVSLGSSQHEPAAVLAPAGTDKDWSLE